jgi:DNA-directed RNA polymerase specialized sigma24 family protein
VCSQKSIWEEAQALLAKFLGGVSIREIADRHGLKERLEKAAIQRVG